jgi:ribonuclease HII
MRAAVTDLAAPPDLVIVDGHLAPPLVTPPCWPIVNGDRLSYRVACASIIAKELRDRLMEFYHDLAPAYAFHRHKGYGTSQHAVLLRRHGPSIFHRRTFRPVAEALQDGLA